MRDTVACNPFQTSARQERVTLRSCYGINVSFGKMCFVVNFVSGMINVYLLFKKKKCVNYSNISDVCGKLTLL